MHFRQNTPVSTWPLDRTGRSQASNANQPHIPTACSTVTGAVAARLTNPSQRSQHLPRQLAHERTAHQLKQSSQPRYLLTVVTSPRSVYCSQRTSKPNSSSVAKQHQDYQHQKPSINSPVKAHAQRIMPSPSQHRCHHLHDHAPSPVDHSDHRELSPSLASKLLRWQPWLLTSSTTRCLRHVVTVNVTAIIIIITIIMLGIRHSSH